MIEFRNWLGSVPRVNLKEEKEILGDKLDEMVGNQLRTVENLYGDLVSTYTEYDKQPDKDPLFDDMSFKVALFLSGGRVLHNCFYSHSKDEWFYMGNIVDKTKIIRWWYEEDALYEI